MSELIYELKKPFPYATKGGGKEEASFITLFEPTFKQLAQITPIKQAITAAITQLNSDDTGDTDAAEGGDDTGDTDASSEPTAAMMLAVLYQWDGKLTSVFLHAQELFKSGAALVEGEVKLTIPLMEKMGVEDFEQMVGEYIAAFLAPSLMAGE